MTTDHLGDLANSCATCKEKYHSTFAGTHCDTCHEYIYEQEDFTCQLCGNKIEDINSARVVLPFGETCGECVREIEAK